jgi:hypothetical protein
LSNLKTAGALGVAAPEAIERGDVRGAKDRAAL